MSRSQGRRRRVLGALALALAFVGAALAGCENSPLGSTEPSSVIILTDDQRWDSLDGTPIVRRVWRIAV
jgi:hypothetical protein